MYLKLVRAIVLDHPAVVRKLTTLDVAPTIAMYEKTSFEFARAYWHWFFPVRPGPFPETLIRADADLYLKQTIGARIAGLKPFTPEVYAEYLRCLQQPDTGHGICEGYRASVTIDLEHDRDSRAMGQKINCDFLALWGAEGVIEKCFDPIAEWRNFSDNVSGHSLPCGHYIPKDSYTTTYGAFGALGFGIGTSEVEHVLATQTLVYRVAQTMRITIDGALPYGTASKDMIIWIISRIGAQGARGYAVEFTGSTIALLSAELCNMTVEAGAPAA